MKSLYKRKVFLVLLFILVIYRTLTFPYYNSPKSILNEKSPRAQSIEYSDGVATFSLVQKLQFQEGVDSYINAIFIILVTWKFILASPFLLKILIIDKRKRILALITRYFEGSKYKHILSFSK